MRKDARAKKARDLLWPGLVAGAVGLLWVAFAVPRIEPTVAEEMSAPPAPIGLVVAPLQEGDNLTTNSENVADTAVPLPIFTVDTSHSHEIRW